MRRNEGGEEVAKKGQKWTSLHQYRHISIRRKQSRIIKCLIVH
jgi:hypothetical protein